MVGVLPRALLPVFTPTPPIHERVLTDLRSLPGEVGGSGRVCTGDPEAARLGIHLHVG